MNHFNRLSPFSKSLFIFNFVIILFFSAFFLDCWSIVVEPLFDTFLFLECFVTFCTLTLYFYWIIHLNEHIIPFKKFLPTLLLIALLAFSIGQHSSANQIHIFVDHPSVLFYDEYLSHWFLVTASALIGSSFIRLELLFARPRDHRVSKLEQILLVSSGIVQGSIVGIYSVEGRSSWIAIIISVGTLAFIIKWLRRRTLAKLPLTLYYSAAYITVVITLITWFLINGGFFEPSAIGFGKF